MMHPSPTRSLAVRSRSRQQGAATLIVVMILFFIMAMMAAYANRNLIFEQRIASNYLRSGAAFEAADSGVEWTLAMLNGVNIDTSCSSSGGAAASSFRQRYLNIDANTGIVTGPAPSGITNPSAACVRGTGSSWNCGCPTTAPWTQTTPVSGTASFLIGLTANGRGLVRIDSLGCSGSNPSLCQVGNEAAANEQQLGASIVRIQAALLSALKSPPMMPLTVLGNVVDPAAYIGLHNTDPQGNGMLLLAGGTQNLSATRLDSAPGTPTEQTLVTSDPTLSAMSASPASVFPLFFGMTLANYQTQPVVRTLSCSPDCADADVSAGITAGMRVIWIDGTLSLTGNSSIGSASSPVVIVATQGITLNGSVTVYGVLYSGANISAGGQAVVNGAVIAAGTFTGTGLVDINYQAAIVNTISNSMGSFIRVPGSWWEGS